MKRLQKKGREAGFKRKFLPIDTGCPGVIAHLGKGFGGDPFVSGAGDGEDEPSSFHPFPHAAINLFSNQPQVGLTEDLISIRISHQDQIFSELPLHLPHIHACTRLQAIRDQGDSTATEAGLLRRSLLSATKL